MLRCLFVTGPELNPGWSPFLKPVLPTQGEAERGNPGEGGPSRQAPGLALSSKQGAEIIAKDTCLHPNDGTLLLGGIKGKLLVGRRAVRRRWQVLVSTFAGLLFRPSGFPTS